MHLTLPQLQLLESSTGDKVLHDNTLRTNTGKSQSNHTQINSDENHNISRKQADPPAKEAASGAATGACPHSQGFPESSTGAMEPGSMAPLLPGLPPRSCMCPSPEAAQLLWACAGDRERQRHQEVLSTSLPVRHAGNQPKLELRFSKQKGRKNTSPKAKVLAANSPSKHHSSFKDLAQSGFSTYQGKLLMLGWLLQIQPWQQPPRRSLLAKASNTHCQSPSLPTASPW